MARRGVGSRVGLGIGFVAVLVFSLFPVFVMISTAVDARANDGSRSLLPDLLHVDNFRFVLDEGRFATYLRNSLVVALSTVLVSGLLALLASVAVSRFRFRFRTSVLVMVLVVQMVPLEALVIPLFIQAKNLGLLNHLLGLVVVYVAFSLPFAIWTLRGFVSAVPARARGGGVRRRRVVAADVLVGAASRWWRPVWSRPACSPSSPRGTSSSSRSRS